MKEIDRFGCVGRRTFLRKSMAEISALVLIVILYNISPSSCYSSVRRSGSVNVEASNNVKIYEVPSVSPMLRPVKENYDPIPNVNEKFADKTNKDDKLEIESKIDESVFKPIPGGEATTKFISKVIQDKNERTKSKTETSSILDDVSEAFELIKKDDVNAKGKLNTLEKELLGFVDDSLSKDSYTLFDGVSIEPVSSLRGRGMNDSTSPGAPRLLDDTQSSKDLGDFDNQVLTKFENFAKSHAINVNLPQTARYFGFRSISSLWKRADGYAKRWLHARNLLSDDDKTRDSGSKSSSSTLASDTAKKTSFKSLPYGQYSGVGAWAKSAYYAQPNGAYVQPNGAYVQPNSAYFQPIGAWANGIKTWPSVTKIWPSITRRTVKEHDKSSETAPSTIKRTSTSFVGNGKSSFLTGFGLGFLAFGLKKLLLPIFIGAQIVKSVLIAMFLPSILGSLGKIVGKGLSQFSGASSNFGQSPVQTDDMDYKDMGYTEEDPGYNYPNTDTVGTLPAHTLYGGAGEDNHIAMSRYEPSFGKVSYIPNASNNQYRYAHKKQDDYKVFHNIPASSLLLSNYDPFYSPLLSRLDSVFQRLGLGDTASSPRGGSVESCREKLICQMYASPAKYAPYSNLVSAQLSRELNELRKPTSDNAEILRFFRYMKAAKDGQEGTSCSRNYPNCSSLSAETGSAAMITTYNDINKLVSARKI